MTTQQPDYNKHPLMKQMQVNDHLILMLLDALRHLDKLEHLSKTFTIELDGSYIEEMQYNSRRLLNAALEERENMANYKGVDKHV